MVEAAVCMRRFEQNQLFSNLAERCQLTLDELDALADVIADFHTKEAAVIFDPTKACSMRWVVEDNVSALRSPTAKDNLDIRKAQALCEASLAVWIKSKPSVPFSAGCRMRLQLDCVVSLNFFVFWFCFAVSNVWAAAK